MSLLFADVRGSTTLAEKMSPADFSASLDGFFEIAFDAVDSEDGVVDHIVGDGVMAMWVPGFVGPEHPRHALAAGRKLVSRVANLGSSFPVGVGVTRALASQESSVYRARTTSPCLATSPIRRLGWDQPP